MDPGQSLPAPYFPVEPWCVSETGFSPELYALGEGVLALANGYMGVRSTFEEGFCRAREKRGHYVATVFNARPHPTVIPLRGCPETPREIVNLPDFSCLRIFADSDPVELLSCEIRNYRRWLDMREGVLRRDVELVTLSGLRIALASTRFLCRRRPHLAAFRVSLTALNRDASLAIESGIDGKVCNADGRNHFSACDPEADDEGWLALRCTTCESGVGVGIFARDTLPNFSAVCDASSAKNGFAGLWFEAPLVKGEPTVFTRLVAVASTADPEAPADPAEFAWHELNHAVETGFEALLDEQAASWQEVWAEGGIDLDMASPGGTAILQGMRYALFQLFQHTGAGLPVAARGLASERASGATSWDKDLFTAPALALLRPEEAKDIVRTKIALLPAAREKAGVMGVAGAVFPWLAGAAGEEACPLWQFSLMGLHATGAAAWSVAFICNATGDAELLATGGLDVIVEAARFWAARVFRPRNRAEWQIRGVVGLDEYHQGVNNDFYTNALARWTLREVGRSVGMLAEKLPELCAAACRRLALHADEISRFDEIADHLRLPVDSDEEISLEFDGFEELEPCPLPTSILGRPVDEMWSFDRLMRSRILRRSGVVAAGLLIPEAVEKSRRCRDFDFYDPITTHDSPLSICHHIIAGIRLGRRERAQSYFNAIARLDLDNVLGNSRLGPHVACLAGLWQCLAHGFLGVDYHRETLAIDPVLPDDWQSLQLALAWQNRRLRVRVTPGEATLSVDRGELDVDIAGQRVRIGETPVRIPLAAPGSR